MPSFFGITDLSLIAVFQEMTPNDQLNASQVCPRCAILVRAANRKVKTLVISCGYGEFHELKDRINFFSLASKPSVQQLMDIPGETFSDYPMITRFSKWNCLLINRDQINRFDTATIHQIVNIFSAVTDLKFMTISSNRINNLVSFLQHPKWKRQLTNLMVDGTRRMKSQLAGELITATNSLPALQLLALDWDKNAEIPDLTILAHLKTVVFKSYPLSAILRSLERNVADNADLQVHLLSDDIETLLTLSQPLRSQVVRYGWYPPYRSDHVPLLCSHFRSLTSVTNWQMDSTKVGELFSNLSPLYQLIHLEIVVYFNRVKEIPPRPLAQLNSLRALELNLHIASHSQIEWLNLAGTMPNLKIIYIKMFECGSCGVRFTSYSWGPRNSSPFLNSSPALDCFRASLFNLHPGVPLKRIILDSGEECISAEKLLLQSQ
ncbi:hypothetical protein TYRP_015551 [Tyrophagus putrescentiae]|nr:hypothetical protein TYRP_015551 [Tyrophagus putrescentiae]